MLLRRSSLAVMPGGSPRLLSRLLLSRSKLGGAVSSEWCAACCKHMADAPHKLSVSSWVNALYALVRLKHTPNRYAESGVGSVLNCSRACYARFCAP